MGEDQTRPEDCDKSVSPVVPQPAGSSGQLKISRLKRGTMGLFSAYKVMVDGYDIGEVRRGQSRYFVVAAGSHEVYLEVDWCRSPSIDIDLAPGETISLACWPKFQAWQAQQGLANPGEWIALEHGTDIDD